MAQINELLRGQQAADRDLMRQIRTSVWAQNEDFRSLMERADMAEQPEDDEELKRALQAFGAYLEV